MRRPTPLVCTVNIHKQKVQTSFDVKGVIGWTIPWPVAVAPLLVAWQPHSDVKT